MMQLHQHEGRDGAGGEKELAEEGTIAAFNGASFLNVIIFTTRKHDLCNFIKSRPSSYFSKVHCDRTAENFASSVLQPVCSILLSNTHHVANCFSVLLLFGFKISQHILTDVLLHPPFHFPLLENSLYHKVFKIVVCSVKTCGLWYLGRCCVSGCCTVLGNRWEHGI